MKVAFTPSFKNSIKNLKRQYRRVADDIEDAINAVLTKPELGTPIAVGCRKLRWSNSDANRGKRGGYRVIYLVDYEKDCLYFLLVYSKSHKEDVTEAEIRSLKDEV